MAASGDAMPGGAPGSSTDAGGPSSAGTTGAAAAQEAEAAGEKAEAAGEKPVPGCSKDAGGPTYADAAKAVAGQHAEALREKAIDWAEEWTDVLEGGEDGDPTRFLRAPIGQVRQITQEVEQDFYDPKVFRVDGKDKSWFLQKGAVTFDRPNPREFTLRVSFLGEARSRFGDDYADLSRAEQQATINWLLMIGVARGGHTLTGYKDCKSSGFYFLLHCNYRRTHWRVIGCPHGSELQDMQGNFHTCNPQDGAQFEVPAFEGQDLGIQYADRKLWLLNGSEKVVLGTWAHGATDGDCEEGTLPDDEYFPAMLTANCPTEVTAEVL